MLSVIKKIDKYALFFLHQSIKVQSTKHQDQIKSESPPSKSFGGRRFIQDMMSGWFSTLTTAYYPSTLRLTDSLTPPPLSIPRRLMSVTQKHGDENDRRRERARETNAMLLLLLKLLLTKRRSHSISRVGYYHSNSSHHLSK